MFRRRRSSSGEWRSATTVRGGVEVGGARRGGGGAVPRGVEVGRDGRRGRVAVGRFIPPIPIWIGEGERDVGIVGSGMGLGFDKGGRGGLVGRGGGPAWLGHGLVGPGAAGSFFLLFFCLLSFYLFIIFFSVSFNN